MSTIRLILILGTKDWLLFWSDRRAALLTFLVPVILASAFGALFHQPATVAATNRLPVLILVEDGAEADGAFTARVVADLLTSPRLAARRAEPQAVAAALAAQRPAVAVVLPRGFDRLTAWQPGSTGERPEVRILHHPAATAERQWAEGVVTEVVMRRLAREKFGGVFGPNDDSAFSTPFRVVGEAVPGGPAARFHSYSHSFCGMTLQYLLFWGMESGLLFLRERQRGVWLRTRAAPVSLGCVLAAKALATAAIALLQVLVTFGFGYLAFGVAVTGSFLGFVLLALAVCALAASTGLLVAAVGGTEARARSVAILVILSVSMVGGLWMPSFLLPGWLRDTALALPTAWAMRGLGAVTWEGRGLAAVLPNVAVVAAFTAAFLTFAVIRLDRSERFDRKGEK